MTTQSPRPATVEQAGASWDYIECKAGFKVLCHYVADNPGSGAMSIVADGHHASARIELGIHHTVNALCLGQMQITCNSPELHAI